MGRSVKNKITMMVFGFMLVQLGILAVALWGHESMMLWVLVSGAILCVAGFALMNILTNWLQRPMEDMLNVMQQMAVGKPSLSHRFPDQDTLFGEIGRIMNQWVDNITNEFQSLSSCIDRVKELGDEFGLTFSQSNDKDEKQKWEAETVVNAISSMTQMVEEVSVNAMQAAEAAKDANEEASSGKDVVSRVTAAIHALAEEVKRAASAIQKLEEDSESIGAILEVIRGIADQTNLLALNAAIEAARAGEQGRGFAVVADEVRTLAQRTQEATEEINDMIARLQEGSSNAVKVMAEGRKQAELSVEQASKAGESLTAITSAVQSISDMNGQIATAVEQQAASSEAVSKNLSHIAEIEQSREQKSQLYLKLSKEFSQALGDLSERVKSIIAAC